MKLANCCCSCCRHPLWLLLLFPLLLPTAELYPHRIRQAGRQAVGPHGTRLALPTLIASSRRPCRPHPPQVIRLYVHSLARFGLFNEPPLAAHNSTPIPLLVGCSFNSHSKHTEAAAAVNVCLVMMVHDVLQDTTIHSIDTDTREIEQQ